MVIQEHLPVLTPSMLEQLGFSKNARPENVTNYHGVQSSVIPLCGDFISIPRPQRLRDVQRVDRVKPLVPMMTKVIDVPVITLAFVWEDDSYQKCISFSSPEVMDMVTVINAEVELRCLELRDQNDNLTYDVRNHRHTINTLNGQLETEQGRIKAAREFLSRGWVHRLWHALFIKQSNLYQVLMK